MPSVSHEALVRLFQECPRLAVALLERAAGIEVPAGAQVQVTASTFSELQPAEYRADVVVRIDAADGQLVRLLILEVQLAADSDKRFSWPLYVTGLRARLRVPVTLVVLAMDETVARWCSQPIALDGLGSTLQPLVLGPAAIPRITSPAEACAFPELAVLSVAAHGHEPGAEELGLAALAGCDALDKQRGSLYADCIFAFLGKAARRALEALMEQRQYVYQSEFARKYFEQGREEGFEQALAKLCAILTDLLEQRFGPLPGEILARIQAANGEQLDRWTRRVIAAASLDDVLASDS